MITIMAVPLSAAEYENDFRSHFETHYAKLDVMYEVLAPAYEYGFDTALNPKYRGRKFHDVESEIRREFLSKYPETDWDSIWDAVFFGWEKAGGAAGGFGFI